MEVIDYMEHWKSVQGYAGIYQVSTSGNVRSLDRIIETSRGVKQRRQGVVLRPRINQEGYRKVTLYKQGRGERFYVAELVAKAFLDSEAVHDRIIRTDGDRVNDQIDNLTVKPSVSQAYASLLDEFDLLLMRHIELSPRQIRDIRRRYQTGLSIRRLALTYQVTENRIRNIIDKKEAQYIS